MLGLADRQRSQQQRVEYGENRRIRADSQGEREDGRDGESGRAPERAQAVAEILERGFDDRDAALVAVSFLHAIDAAEIAVGGGAGFLRGEAIEPVLFGERFEVEADLVLEVALGACAARQGRKPAEQGSHHPS